jgi:hypothetical protein
MRLSNIRPVIVGLTLAVGLIATPAYAQKGPNADENAAVVPHSNVQQLVLAHQLYAYGVKDEDPMLVIAAARLMSQISTKDVKSESENSPEPGDGAKKSAAKSSSGDEKASPPNLKAMIAKGRELAGDQKALQAMLDDVEGTKSKATTSGGGRSHKYLPPRTRAKYFGGRLTYRGGQRAEVGVAGNGATNLDLYVYDQNGNLICKSTRGWDREFCAWYPRWTGPFKVHVLNRGRRGNNYVIYWN